MVDQETFLYLTTVGRKSGLPRKIEIWFVEHEGSYYVLSEMGRRANWVRNIERNSAVEVKVGKSVFKGSARVLDEKRDSELWRKARQLSQEKYGWGDGLPVEIRPVE